MNKFHPVESETPNAPLALRPPYFPSSTTLTDPDHYAGGIPIRALEGDLQCIVSAWLAMGIGDKVEMYWQSLTSPVVSKTIEFDHELDKPVVLWIPREHVLDGDAMPVFYQVTQGTQTPERSEPLETYLVKTTRPGNYDDSPEEGHSGFNYTFITDVSGGVDADMADRGVQMRIEPYEHRTTFDRIVCRWGSQEVIYYPVTQAQVDDPVNNPIIITFTRAVIEAAGDGTRVVVTFQVIDRVDNRPDERAPWAKFAYVKVDLDGNRLEAPLVLVGSKPTNTINLEDLRNDDVNVRVYTRATDFAVDDTVRLTWTGTPAQGSPIIVGPLVKLVDYVPFHLDFFIPNAAVKAIAQGFATVSYVRIRSGEADQPSKNASVSVEGDISRLPAPSVVQAPNGTLPADSPYATISVAYYEGRKPGDLITIHCQGKRPGGGETYYQIPIIVSGEPVGTPIERGLPGSEISPLNGGTLKIYYTVANDDELAVRSERDSLVLELNVGVALPEFRAPDVTEADSKDVLLPENAPTGANITARFNDPVIETRAKDIVGLRWVGSVTGAHPLYEIPLTIHTAGKPVPFWVDPRHIGPNLNGTVTVDYYLKRAGEPLRFSRERVLSIGSARLELTPPTLLPPATSPIDVLTYASGVTVQMTFASSPGDKAQLKEINPAPGAVPFPEQDFIGGQSDFNLSPAFLAARHGKDVDLIGVLIQPGTPPVESLPLVLTVSRIADGDVRLPVPSIPETKGTAILDLNTFAGDATASIEPWLPLIALGQKVWCQCVGTREDGSTIVIPILENKNVTEKELAEGINQPIPRTKLNDLKNNSELLLEFRVALSTADDETETLKFQTLKTNIISAPNILIDDFDYLTPHFSLPSVTTKHMTMQKKSAGLGLDVVALEDYYMYPGKVEGIAISFSAKPAYATETGTIIFNSTHPKVKFFVSLWSGSDRYDIEYVKYDCYSSSGSFLDSKTIRPKSQGPTELFEIVFEKPNIKTIEVTTLRAGGSFISAIDNMELTP